MEDHTKARTTGPALYEHWNIVWARKHPTGFILSAKIVRRSLRFMVLSEETRFQGCRVVPGTGDVKASPQTTQCPDPNLEIRPGGGGGGSSRPLDKVGGSKKQFFGPSGLSLI